MKKVLTYGTFDLLHIGHINYLKRAHVLGNYVVVGLSTDDFNISKSKRTFYPYEERKAILMALRFVNEVIPTTNWSWEQKLYDITEYEIDILVMSLEWRGKLDDLKNACDIVYLPRTRKVSPLRLADVV